MLIPRVNHSDTNLTSQRIMVTTLQLRAREDYSVTFPPLSITRYLFIQLSELRRSGENENYHTSKWRIRTASLSIASPVFYTTELPRSVLRSKSSISGYVIERDCHAENHNICFPFVNK